MEKFNKFNVGVLKFLATGDYSDDEFVGAVCRFIAREEVADLFQIDINTLPRNLSKKGKHNVSIIRNFLCGI